MSNYNQIVAFGPKDSLPSGTPAKRILGAEIDPELAAIAAAIATKLDSANLATEVGTQAIIVNTNSPTANTIGFRGLPPIISNDSYTFTNGDMGRMFIHPLGAGAGDVVTIPANSSVAYPVGTTLTIVNRDTNTLSIQITSDTLILAGTTSTGARTLSQNGMATAIKIETALWLIAGPGLT